MSSPISYLHFSRFFIISLLGITLLPLVTCAQDNQSYKAGVVRIQNTKSKEVGTGFIIKIDKERAYIITAAHVVRGNASPNIYFFNRPKDPLQAALINREDDDQKGLALLEVKANRETLKGLVPLKLGKSSIKGGEVVSVIGFPDGTTIWSITSASVSRLEGRNLVFSGPIRGGNSGGPVLFNGRVIGLVTDTLQDLDYAVRVENIVNYIEGLPQLSNLLKVSETEPSIIASSPENSKFCQALAQIINASRNDFSTIVNLKSSTSIGSLLESSISLPGTSRGLIYVESKYARFSVDSKTSSEYYKLISMIKLCLPTWSQTDSSEDKTNVDSDLAVVQPSKYYRFTESDKGVTVEINQREIRSSSFDRSYYTDVSIYASDSTLNPGRLVRDEREARSILNFISDEDRADEVCQAILKIVDASHSDFYSIVKPTNTEGLFYSTLEIPGFPSGLVRPRDRISFIIGSNNNNDIEGLYYRLIAIVRGCLMDWKQKESPEDASALNENNKFYQFFENKNGAVIEIHYSNPRRAIRPLTLIIYSPNSPALPK